MVNRNLMAFLSKAIRAVGYNADYALMAVRVTLSGVVTTASGIPLTWIYVLYIVSNSIIVTIAGTWCP